MEKESEDKADESWLEIFQYLFSLFILKKNWKNSPFSDFGGVCVVVLFLLLFTLQEKSSTMYLPTEGQETVMPFFSVTNHGTFPEYFPEILREAISFLSKRRDNANIKSIKITCNCNFYSLYGSSLTFISFCGKFGCMLRLCLCRPMK